MTEKLYSLSDVCRMTGVAYYRLYYALQMGKIPEAPKIGRQRVFGADDVERIKTFFADKGKVAK